MITVILAAPTFAASYAITNELKLSSIVTFAFLFGGFMFGPDLDTGSKQYSRWHFLKALWLPYRSCFKHRSRWSHGLIFGTLIRVVYLMGVVTISAFAGAYTYAVVMNGALPNILSFASGWRDLGALAESYLVAIFIGLWIGAASHTFTDMAGSFIKTGRVTEFL